MQSEFSRFTTNKANWHQKALLVPIPGKVKGSIVSIGIKSYGGIGNEFHHTSKQERKMSN
ncbi:MAG: hypothetical protein WAV82_04105 [Methylobacter sp.]